MAKLFTLPYLLNLAVLPLLSQAPLPVSIEAIPGGRVVIPVQALHADGKPRTLRMLLDTGAMTCMLDRRATAGLLVGPGREVQIAGFAPGTRLAQRYAFRALSLGPRTRTDVPVVVLDMANSQRWTDEPVDGFIGMSFLEGGTFTLDPQHREFRWGLPDASCLWIPLTQRDRDPRPFTRLDVGNGPEAVLLDTGAEGTLYGVDLPLGEDCEVAGGLTGVRSIGVGRRSLEIFGTRYEGVRVCSGGDLRILGAAFLCAGAIVFDFPGKRIGLVQDTHGNAPRPSARSGEAFFPVAWNRSRPEAFLEVVALQPCSRWHRAGFHEGDRILEVEGVAEPLTLSKLNQRIREGLPLRWVVLRKGRRLSLISPPEAEIRWFLGS